MQIIAEGLPVRFLIIEAKALHDFLLRHGELDGRLGAKMVAETRHNVSSDEIAVR